MSSKTSISIVIPARDEAENLVILIPEIYNILEKLSLNYYEIIVLNHGSNDNTSSVISDFKSRNMNISEIFYPRTGFKLGQVLYDGIRNAKGDFIITMDGDNSHQPCALNSIIDAWRNGCDFIIGVRYEKNQPPFKPRQRYIISTLFNYIARLFIRTGFSDYTSGYRGFSKVNFKRIEKSIKSKGFEFHLELNGKLSKIANNPKPIQINYIKREQGVSKLKYGKEFFGYLKAILWCFIYPKKRR